LKKAFGLIGLIALLLVSAWTVAAEPIENQEYVRIQPPQSNESPGKIEVIEFFSFACNHCKDFNPVITAWAAKLPKDVVFKRVPVTFNRKAWANLAKLFYALEATGDLHRLDNDIFTALHEQKVNLADETTAIDWVSKKGVDKQKFANIYKSFGIDSKVARGQQMSERYGIGAVPSLIVGNRYRIINEKAGSHQGQTALADRLIQKVRAENKKK